MFPLVQLRFPHFTFSNKYTSTSVNYPIFPQAIYPDLAGKVTGMLLDIDNAEILHMLVDHNTLRDQVCLLHFFC